MSSDPDFATALTQKAIAESPSKNPLMKLLAVKKIAKCPRNEETLVLSISTRKL
jgi:hypothetical protein